MMHSIYATSMHFEDPNMGYPDNFSARACDQMWGHDETLADDALFTLSDMLRKLRAIPRDDACEDALNWLEGAFNDAIGEIERNRL